MDREKPTALGSFDPLFSKNVPHILEKIFSALDYDSFLACHSVCKVWNNLLSLESYRQISEKLLKEKQQLLKEKQENKRAAALMEEGGYVMRLPHNMASAAIAAPSQNFKEWHDSVTLDSRGHLFYRL